ncbi:MAG: ATP-binding cassette domain-containing protein [Candidatus Accumulibacter sp.]|jgi:putative ABC transport system ATP-binding protein|nr:ATP-binding cassette domain-containing protein [Accumulibacter sp.]
MGQTLCVEELAWRFPGQRHALFEIAGLDVPAGSSLGIRGPSGAGKTTLFHCLSGIAVAESGRVRWDGLDLRALSPEARDRWRQRNVGLVFQDFHLIEGLAAFDNVLLPACFEHWRAPPELRRRAGELLEAVGVDCRERDVALLSRGERQRVALARALLFAPGIVIADEPTASLDPEHRTRVGELLAGLARTRNATLIVVSHDQELLARLDHCVALEDGRLR